MQRLRRLAPVVDLIDIDTDMAIIEKNLDTLQNLESTVVELWRRQPDPRFVGSFLP